MSQPQSPDVSVVFEEAQEAEIQKVFGTLDDQRHLAETQNIREFNRDLRLNRKLRWKYARWVFRYLVGYSAFVALLLLGCGFDLPFDLSEGVLSFLVGSTAASAIGLVLAVTVGLFRPITGNLNTTPIRE